MFCRFISIVYYWSKSGELFHPTRVVTCVLAIPKVLDSMSNIDKKTSTRIWMAKYLNGLLSVVLVLTQHLNGKILCFFLPI
jgi:hypothetical protein